MSDAPQCDWEKYQQIYSNLPLSNYAIDICQYSDRPSNLFEKYFKKSHHFIKRCYERNAKYKAEGDIVDQQFLDFYSKTAPFSTRPSYVMTKPSVEIGYREASKFNLQSTIQIPEFMYNGALQFWTHLVAPYLKMEFITNTEARVGRDMTTSCGFPLNTKFRMRKDAMSHPAYETAYMEYFSSMSDPLRYVPSIACSSVKLEMKKIEKVVQEDTARTFMPVPLFANELSLQYYKKYVECIADHYRDIPFSLGYTDKYRGADQLVRWLKFEDVVEKGEPILFIESDVSGWDRSVQPPLQAWAHDALKIVFPPEFHEEPHKSRIRNMYFDEVFHHLMLEHGDIVFVTGVFSGEFQTLTKNSTINILEVYGICLFMKPDLRWDEFISVFRFRVQGDDMLAALRIKYCTWFSKEKWQHCIENIYGMKLKHLRTTYNIEEIEFLGRHFRLTTWGCYLAFPSRDKIIDACSICKTDDVSARLSRLLSLRIESFPDQPLFAFLTKWCNEFFRLHDSSLRRKVGPYQTNDGRSDWVFTYEKLRAQFLSEGAVRALHLGFQNEFANELAQVSEWLIERPCRITDLVD